MTISEAISAIHGYIDAMSRDPHNDTQLYHKTRALEGLDALGRGDEQVEVGQAPVGEQGDGSAGDKPEAGSGNNVVGEGQGQNETGVQSE